MHEGGEARYDYLVLATGATHSYFGHDHWAEHAPGLKTVEDALEIRRRVLLAFEEAEQEADPDVRRAKLTFVVVGAGPTGVELAGALKEIAAQTIPADFRNIDTTTARVILLEGTDRVLPAMPPGLSARARRDLAQLGVEVRTGALVTDVTDRRRAGGRRVPAGGQRALGGGCPGLAAGREPGRAPGPPRPGDGRAGPLGARPSRGLRGG